MRILHRHYPLAQRFVSRLRQLVVRPSTAGQSKHQSPSRKNRAKAGRDGLTKRLADAVQSNYRFAADAGGRLRVYESGAYKASGEQLIQRQVKKLLGAWNKDSDWSSYLTREVVEYIRVDAPQLWERPPTDVVNVKNGLLELETNDLKPHDPEHLSPIQIPVEYDPKATCPDWEQFVRQTFPRGRAQELAWEIAGTLLVPDTSIQKAILLVGEGGNGKSAYLSGLTALVGHNNVSTVSLHYLTSNRFAAAQLVGKLANICPDLPTKRLEDTEIFKAISGGDFIQAEQKYRPGFSFRPFARLIFSANALPQSKDCSQAYFDRWIIIPFEQTFRGKRNEVPRQVLDARLADPKELSGVLNKAIAALRCVRESGRFTESQSTRRALREFREVTDHVAVWLDAVVTSAPGCNLLVRELRAAYNKVAERERRPVMTDSQFGKALKRLRPEIKKARRGPKEEREWVYLDITIATEP